MEYLGYLDIQYLTQKLARQLKSHNDYHMLSNFHDKLIEIIISDHQFNKSKKDFVIPIHP